MEIIKFTVIAVICAVTCLLFKQLRPELVPFAEIAAVIVLVAMFAQTLKDALTSILSLVENIGIVNDGYVLLLIKIIVVAVISKTGADICRDCGNSAIAVNVELAGKVIILMMCFPLLETIVELADGLLS